MSGNTSRGFASEATASEHMPSSLSVMIRPTAGDAQPKALTDANLQALMTDILS